MKSILLIPLLVCLVQLPSARAQIPSDPANSLVRFRITGGGNVRGDVIVELFDRDKPATVRNFLAYVNNGSYSNVIIHRSLPNFVAQGGFGRVNVPRATTPFDSYVPVESLGTISNEFNVGPRLSNLAGTIAMARLSGSTNSATSEWFFNLGDNPELDDVDGGFTVFGQVISGANVLNYFNSIALSNGIVDMRWFFGNTASVFQNLPVAYFGTIAPRIIDLFTVQVTALVAPPTVAITSPADNARVTNANVVVTGTAADDARVRRVFYTLNDGPETPAVGSNDWTAAITLTAGTNRFVVQSEDTSTNLSLPLLRRFFLRVPSPISLATNGAGTVSGLVNGQALDVGVNYKLTAKPARGYLFAGWSGDVVSSNLTLIFRMETNLSVTANFIPNPFIAVKGTYSGLFAEASGALPASAGSVSLVLADTGAFTANFLLAGKKAALKGAFNTSGYSSNVVKSGTALLPVELSVDLTNMTGLVTGRVIGPGWEAVIEADRAGFSRTNPAPYAGSYTLLFLADQAGANAPVGAGYATVTVDAAGAVSLAGALADGSKVTQKTTLSATGRTPQGLSLYGGLGLHWGWLQFPDDPNGDVTGDLKWVRPGGIRGSKVHSAGFTNDVSAVGARYNPTNGFSSLSAATLSFTGGNLTEDFSADVLIGAKKITNNSPHKLTMKLTPKTGLIGGTVTPTNSTRSIKFNGVYLQNLEMGSGFFLGTNVSGRFSVMPQP